MTPVLVFFIVTSSVIGIFSVYNAVLFSRKTRYHINNNNKKVEIKK